MIRFSAALVAVAIGVLIGGIATSKLLLVYIAIAVSAVALVALVVGVVLKREELFGEGQGLVSAAAGAGPVLPAHAGGSQGMVPSSGYVAPPPPAAGAAAGYGVPFGGVAQATASPGAGLAAAHQGAARRGRTAEPVPPWETAATRETWTPDWMPAGKDQRATSGADVRAPSAWQDTAPPAPAPPRAWAAPPTMPTPVPSVPSDAPAAKPDAGSEATTPSWFDRLGKPVGTDTPTVPSAPVPPAPGPGSGSGWSWSSRDTGTPGGPVAQEEPAAPSAGSGDEDDDWPARYSWLDDEPDQPDEPDESVASVDMGQAGNVARDDQDVDKGGKPAAAAEEPVGAAAETGATVIAFRSRKDPEPEEPSPASEADKETGPADATAEPEADRDADSEPGAEAASESEDESEDELAATPTPDGAALVAVVRGVPRYHKPDCVLIRFMPEGDLQKLTVPQAKEDGCTPCTACQPAG